MGGGQARRSTNLFFPIEGVGQFRELLLAYLNDYFGANAQPGKASRRPRMKARLLARRLW